MASASNQASRYNAGLPRTILRLGGLGAAEVDAVALAAIEGEDVLVP